MWRTRAGAALTAGLLGAPSGPSCTSTNSGFIDIVSDPKPPPRMPMPCVENAQCAGPAERFCSPSGSCVQCLDDASCAMPTPYCDLVDGRCVECLDLAHCAPDRACDLGRHRCLATCSRDDDCAPMTPFCDAARMLCAACAGDSGCADPKKPVCDPMLGRCTP